MNFKCRLHILLFIVVFSLPLSIYAYSNKVILGGQNIGIRVEASHVMVVGFYDVDGQNIAKNSGFQIGDEIIRVNGKEILNIEDMSYLLEEKNIFTILRNNKEKDIGLSIKKDQDGVLKTGIYVKDSISGIGTLTYIDSESRIFGALGHEIVEQSTKKKLEIRSGEIFSSTVTSITKSDSGNPGEKNATFHLEDINGRVLSNKSSGIFGIYSNNIETNNVVEVGSKESIKKGKAQMFTVINGNSVEAFDINIIKIDDKSDTKNLLFEIVDEKLKDASNGIVSGMSGSPIVQNGKLIAAVTHVVIQDPMKGYGIFIETMLKEGDESKE